MTRVHPSEITFLAVRILIRDAVDAHRHRRQARDEVHQVHVVAADVRKRVRIFDGAPILEIRMAVVPLFHQASGAQAEFAEIAGSIFAPGKETAIVKTLVVFNTNEEAAAQ